MEPHCASKPVTINERSGAARRWQSAWLVLAIAVAYSNTLNVPFLFDDISSVVTNPSIRRLWPLSQPLSPPPLLTVSGRPLVNLSLAINYAISGVEPWSYHILNAVVHAAAALTLMGILRRTFADGRLRGVVGSNAAWSAWAAATVWALHPLLTESVTYVVQRAESLMALGYLFTLYAFVRGVQQQSRSWMVAAVVACFAAVASKEVAVSAPLVILLYDRTFLAGSFQAAWRQRRTWYLALASSWVLLAWLSVTAQGRGGTVGFDTDVSAWHYLLTQVRAIWIYLKLSAWPAPLVFDYGSEVIKRVADVTWDGLVILGLLAGTIWALVRKPALGFSGAAFFLILAPTSSFVPVATQTIAEHRMYLPLATLIALATGLAVTRFKTHALTLLLATAVVLGVMTWQRNQVYREDLRLWQDTLTHRPESARAHYNVAFGLAKAGRTSEAVTQYEQAINFDPFFAEAHGNLAGLLAKQGRHGEALEHYETAARLDPDSPETRNNFGFALARAGRLADAIGQYQEALRLRSDFAEAHNNLGGALAQSGRPEEALDHIAQAIRLKPVYAGAYANQGSALLQLGRVEAATTSLEQALKLEPKLAEAHSNLGLALLKLGRRAEAATHYREVLAVAPDDLTAHNNLGFLALQRGATVEAIEHYSVAVRVTPEDPEARYNLGVALERGERWTEAAEEFRSALRLRPAYVEAQRELARLQRRTGQ